MKPPINASPPAMGAGATRGTAVEQHIAAISTLSTTLLTGLDTALEQISGVNRTTHLLSVNARIEAARAGDAGHSFAVVATEMNRLSSQVEAITQDLRAQSHRTGAGMRDVVAGYVTQVRDARLCELALVNIDLIDRNLYERSCDVRWWATDAAAVACARDPSPAACAYAARRLGQILDSYTVYQDLVLVDGRGRVLANGRPAAHPSAGADVSGEGWFTQALASRSGAEFGCSSVHASPLVGGKRVLVYSCAVREGGEAHGAVLGVLGILFDWDALALTVLRRTPLTPEEWAGSRACIIDSRGQVLADSRQGGSERIDLADWKPLLDLPRGSRIATVDGERCCIAHAASPGYETYRSGWHSLIIQRLGH